MRQELARRDGERATFTGVFERFGTKNGWKGRQEKTVLLKDIRDASGKMVCDHLWFNLTVGMEALNLQPGDRVRFDARVKPYLKGYRGRREDVWDKPIERDYKLSYPTRLIKLPASADALPSVLLGDGLA